MQRLIDPLPTSDLPENVRNSFRDLDDRFEALRHTLLSKPAPPPEGRFVVALKMSAESLPGTVSGVLLAVEGFQNGDALTGVQGLMDTCASLAPVISSLIGAVAGFVAPGVGTGLGFALGGLVGTLIGSICTAIGQILGFLAPQTETVAQQIANILKDLKADEVQIDAKTVHNSFFVYAGSLNTICGALTSKRFGLGASGFRPAQTTMMIRQLNFVDGVTMNKLWGVFLWLAEPKNQNHPRWPVILDAACNAYSVLMIAVMRLTTIVTSIEMGEEYDKADEHEKRQLEELWDTAVAQLRIYSVVNKVTLANLRSLVPVAQNWGTLWRLKPELECGVVNPSVQTSQFGGADKKLSPTVCSKDQTKQERTYQSYCIFGDNKLAARLISSDKKEADRHKGDRHPLSEDIKDVFATPGTDLKRPNYAYVYTLADGKRVGDFTPQVIHLDLRNEEGKAIAEPATTPTALPFHYVLDRALPIGSYNVTSLTSVRAVHDPYTYDDDPARGYLEAGGCLPRERVKYIVYATAGTAQIPISGILVFISGLQNMEPLVLRLPFDNVPVRGIAVDQDYLWVFSGRKFACTSHAQVVRKVKPPSPDADRNPVWIECTTMPQNNKDIHLLYPCDDGTLIASIQDGPVYSGAYRIQNKEIISYDRAGSIQWTQIRKDNPTRAGLEKLPVFCWPQFEGLVDTLEAFQKALGEEKVLGEETEEARRAA